MSNEYQSRLERTFGRKRTELIVNGLLDKDTSTDWWKNNIRYSGGENVRVLSEKPNDSVEMAVTLTSVSESTFTGRLLARMGIWHWLRGIFRVDG